MSSLELATTSKKTKECVFCGTDIEDKVQLGDLLHCDGLYVHYFCMLLSSALEQRGETDNDGILGFLPEDILIELRRGKRLKCCFCKKVGATLGCCGARCKKTFHLPCGLKNDTLHQFFGNFSSYCSYHRPNQVLPSDVIITRQHSICPICLSSVENKITNHTLYSPCCKNGWFHRSCIQCQALSTGYFFRCPLCNNLDTFQEEMHLYGIYIPEQDAAWEMDQNAYEDLLFRYCQCDASICKCPEGRKYNKDKSCWEMAVCRLCGSQGCHSACGDILLLDEWECDGCSQINSKYAVAPAEITKPKVKAPKLEKNMSQYISKSKMQPSKKKYVRDLIIKVDRIDSLVEYSASDKDIKELSTDGRKYIRSHDKNAAKLNNDKSSVPSPYEIITLDDGSEKLSCENISSKQSSRTFHPYLHVITAFSDVKSADCLEPRKKSPKVSTISVLNLPDSTTEPHNNAHNGSPESCVKSYNVKLQTIVDGCISSCISTVREAENMKRSCETKDAPLPKRHCNDLGALQSNSDHLSPKYEAGHSGPCIKTLLKQPCTFCDKRDNDYDIINPYHTDLSSVVQHAKNDKGFPFKILQNCKSLKPSIDSKTGILSCRNNIENKFQTEKKHKRGKCTPLHCNCHKTTPHSEKTLKSMKGSVEERKEIDSKFQNGIASDKTQLSLLQLFKRMKPPLEISPV